MLCVGLLGNFHIFTSEWPSRHHKKKGTHLLSLTSPGVTHTFTNKDRDNEAVSFNISAVGSVAESKLGRV